MELLGKDNQLDEKKNFSEIPQCSAASLDWNYIEEKHFLDIEVITDVQFPHMEEESLNKL